MTVGPSLHPDISTMNRHSELHYQAEILQTRRHDHAVRLRSLQDRADYQVVDALETQLSDLLQSRSPARAMDASEMKTAIAQFMKDKGPHYARWAHYPWARRLVRVLPEDDFVELRTNRNQQKITAAEQRRLACKKVGVVGLSVGQSVALTLALERSCGEIRLADFDVIDLSNLNRLRTGIHNIGLPKTVVAAREIAELDPYLRIVCFHDGYTEANGDRFLEGLDLAIDECDSLDVKIRMREAARKRGVPVLMNTSDRGMTDIERFDVEPDRPLFHGRVKHVDAEKLAGLGTLDKVPIVLDIIGLSSSSVRARASMLEIEQSIKTWPQLASDVTLGGAIVCDVTRRILLSEPVSSGRFYMDLSDVGAAAVGDEPPAASTQSTAPAVRADRHREPYDCIVDDATLAPSAGNSQPWRWERAGSVLTLHHEPSPHGNVLDFEHKADMVGLGATLESALISARHHGFYTDVTLHGDDAAVASVSLSDMGACAREPLYLQLARRRSVRTRPKFIRPVPPSLFDAAMAQVREFPGLRLNFVTDREQIDTLSSLMGQAERLRMLDANAHADLLREVAWSEPDHQRTGLGLPISSLSLSAAEEAGFQIMRDPAVVAKLSEWKLGGGMSKLSRELVRSSSAIGLLWCDNDTHADFMAGGRALQRIWLEATRMNVGLCPLVTLCYLLSAWRAQRPMTTLQAEALPDMDRRYRAVFDLPESRGDIALFRLVSVTDEFEKPRTTYRRAAMS